MDMLNRLCLWAARVYRTLNRPILRSKLDVDCDLYSDTESEKPVAALKIKDSPEIKLMDLILAICAIKLVVSAVKAVSELFGD